MKLLWVPPVVIQNQVAADETLLFVFEDCEKSQDVLRFRPSPVCSSCPRVFLAIVRGGLLGGPLRGAVRSIALWIGLVCC